MVLLLRNLVYTDVSKNYWGGSTASLGMQILKVVKWQPLASNCLDFDPQVPCFCRMYEFGLIIQCHESTVFSSGKRG